MVCLLRPCSRRQLRIQDADNRRHTRKANGPRFVLAHDFTGWPVDRIHLFWPGAERHGHILLRVAAAQNSCSSSYRQFLLYVVYRQSLSGIRGCSGGGSQFLECSSLRRSGEADHALQLTGTHQRRWIVPGRSYARDPPRNREQRRRSLQQPQIDLTCLICPQTGKVASCQNQINSAITSFYKRECQEKNFPGDWKERKCSLYVPAHVMLRDSGAFLFFQIHLVIVTALSASEARQAVWLKRVNHGSI